MTELERTRKALEEAIACLQQLSILGSITFIGNDMAQDGLAKVDAILNPPEFEEVEVVRWYNIYPLTGGFHLDCTHGFATREEADNDASTERIGCQDIRVKVKHPVKRVVVKEVSVEGVQLNEAGSIDYWPGMHGTALFNQHRECHGKTVTLIARWTE